LKKTAFGVKWTFIYKAALVTKCAKGKQMNITRKNFLRLTSATTMAAAIEAALTACGGGGGGGGGSSSSSASISAGAGAGTVSTTPSNPSSGTGDGSIITPPTTPPASPSKSGYWSNPLTWAAPGMPAGFVPTASDNIYISSAQTVYLDGDAVCGTLTIYGTLRSLDNSSPDLKSISLTTGNINIMGSGALQIGTETAPFPTNFTATITLNGAEVGRVRRTVLGSSMGFTNSGEGRSIRVESGGKLSLIGIAPATKRTKLAAHAAAATKNFTVIENAGWKINDEIVIGTTDFFGVSVPEKLVITAVNTTTKTISTSTGITSKRWGVMQYVTDQPTSVTGESVVGITTNPNYVTTNGPVGTPTSLDERAFVINLTRNIVVQGANDTAWASNKFGAHCMFMGRTSDIKLDGVQFRRVGQAGALGRYPIHWHMMSFNMPSGMNAVSDGTFLGAVVGNHYAKNCAISESSQRMIVIHGTHGVALDSNVGFDITGHAIFMEDGSEQDNVITNNVVIKVRAPTTGNRLQSHDAAATYLGLGVNQTVGTAGIWNTNPKNTFTGNWINDSEGAGFWNSFAETCFGLSVNVAISPFKIPFTLIDNNWAYGCSGAGALTNDRVINDLGETGQTPYAADFTGSPVQRYNLFKNAAGGYSNRITTGQYQAFICADNAGMDVFGQATIDTSLMKNTLSVAESLNNSNSRRLSSYRAAFATYHELLNFKDIMAVGFTYIKGALLYPTVSANGGGLFRIWDLYLQPYFSFSLNTGFKLINCDAPFRTLPPAYDGQPDNNRHWTIAGAIKDTHGIFGIQGKYWVYKMPFFTYGITNQTDITPGVPENGVATTDKYYGVGNFMNGTDTTKLLPLNVSRQDSNGTEVGSWTVADGSNSTQLGIMRHFSAHNGGRFVMSNPTSPAPNYFDFEVMGMDGPNDIFMVGVPFGSAYTPRVFQEANGRYNRVGAQVNMSNTARAIASGRGRLLTSTPSLANVASDTTGTLFYRDTVNNLVWMQVKLYALSTAAISSGYYGTDPLDNEYRSTTITVSV
jgi:hypothetical protein